MDCCGLAHAPMAPAWRWNPALASIDVMLAGGVGRGVGVAPTFKERVRDLTPTARVYCTYHRCNRQERVRNTEKAIRGREWGTADILRLEQAEGPAGSADRKVFPLADAALEMTALLSRHIARMKRPTVA